VVVGGVIDRKGPAPVMVYGAAAMGATVAALGWIASPWQLFAVLVVMGTAWACLGSTAFASVFGMASAAMQIGVAIGPGLVGVLRDATGGYAVAVAVLAALDAGAVAGVLWGRRGGAAFDRPTANG
jgi:hypothetical protein